MAATLASPFLEWPSVSQELYVRKQANYKETNNDVITQEGTDTAT